ncbi:MAG TPA: DinB family protein [Pseudonocardiaceae bacterium]|jgi:hypothetical protein|nr:DinB family protein [Pseudonocardiaceae bacterium]
MDRQAVHDELESARTEFHRLLDGATEAELRRPSDGTRWTNQELLFHMLFGYLIVRALLVLVRVFSHLPVRASRGYARLLDAGTTPFDVVNYYGSRIGARLLTTARLRGTCDRVIMALHRRLDAETDEDLAGGMHYPTRWDPFFADYLTLADIYRYPTQHFRFHREQLTLDATH